MDKKRVKKQERFRTGFQLAFTALTNGYVQGFVQGKIYQGPSKEVCLPGLNCYSCPGALGACPIGAMQAIANDRNFTMPSGTLMAGWPLALFNEGLRTALGFLFVWKSVILIVLILLSLMIYRPFCRYLCPLGAVYGLFNKLSLYRLRVDEARCTGCGACKASCRLNIDPRKTPNSLECIRCGRCVKACDAGALRRGIK